jgi:Tol biopolymer transport system component
VPGDTNRTTDVFVRDRLAKVTRRVSLGRGGREPNGESFFPVISRRGRYVAFVSDASNLVRRDTNDVGDVFVRDMATRKIRRVSVGTGGRQANSASFGASISANGRFVAFMSDAPNLVRGDTNRTFDAFVRDRRTGVTRRVSVGRGGRESNDFSEFPVLSANGRLVVFVSGATNLVPRDTNRIGDIFVRDRAGNARTAPARAETGP